MFGLARSPLWRDQLAVSAKRRCSKPTFLVSIVNRLGADAKQTTMNLDALINDTIDVVFDNWVSRFAVTVEGDRAVLLIVTSAD